jgi:hypothetical protein
MVMSETLGEQEASEKRDRSPPEPSWLLPAKIASVVMGLMIIVGVIVLGVTVYKRMAGEDMPSSPPASVNSSVASSIDLGDVQLALPPRARVVDMALDGNRLVLHLQLASRDRALMIVDLRSGKSEGLIRLIPGELPK